MYVKSKPTFHLGDLHKGDFNNIVSEYTITISGYRDRDKRVSHKSQYPVRAFRTDCWLKLRDTFGIFWYWKEGIKDGSESITKIDCTANLNSTIA